MEILKTYRQSMPATRFIGIKYGDEDRVGGLFGAKWGDFFSAGHFNKIEAAAGGTEKLNAYFEDAGAYIGLMRVKDGEPFQYWIGMFTPVGTQVPEDFSYIDFSASDIGVAWVYGDESKGEIYGVEPQCMEKLGENGMTMRNFEDGSFGFCERYACPRYTTPDEKGNVILDICFFI